MVRQQLPGSQHLPRPRRYGWEAAGEEVTKTLPKVGLLEGGTVPTFKPISMKSQDVELVTQFKPVNQLKFQDHLDYIFKKGRQRLPLLRKLRSLNTSQRTMTMVYKSLTESVLRFNSVSWYGNLSVKQKRTDWHKSSTRAERSLDINNINSHTCIHRF